jgi:hypothetical protein
MIREKMFFDLVYKANQFFKRGEFCRLTAHDGVAFAFHFFEKEFIKSPPKLIEWMGKFDNSTLNGVLEHIPFVNCTPRPGEKDPACIEDRPCPLRVAMENILKSKRMLTSQRLEDLFSALEAVAKKEFPIGKSLQTREIIAETCSSEDGFFAYLAGGTFDGSKLRREGHGIYVRTQEIVHYRPGIYFVYDEPGLFNNEPWLSPKQRVDFKELMHHMSEPYSQRHFVKEAEFMLRHKDLKNKSTSMEEKRIEENRQRSKSYRTNTEKFIREYNKTKLPNTL